MRRVPFQHLLDQTLKLRGILSRQRVDGPLTYFQDKIFPTICLELKSKSCTVNTWQEDTVTGTISRGRFAFPEVISIWEGAGHRVPFLLKTSLRPIHSLVCFGGR